jgi:hypothetical protein
MLSIGFYDSHQTLIWRSKNTCSIEHNVKEWVKKIGIVQIRDPTN